MGGVFPGGGFCLSLQYSSVCMHIAHQPRTAAGTYSVPSSPPEGDKELRPRGSPTATVLSIAPEAMTSYMEEMTSSEGQQKTPR